MFLLIGIVLAMSAVAGMMLRELMLYREKRHNYPQRRLTLRISMAVMLLFLLASILVGIRVFHLGSPVESGYAQLWAAFWGAVMLLITGIFCLVIADLRTISVDSEHNTNALWRDIAEIIAAHETKRRKDR